MLVPRRLQGISGHLSNGRFRAGLAEFVKTYDPSTHVDRVLMAEFLVRTGELTKAEDLLNSLVQLPSLTGSLKARCYEHLAYLIKQREGLESSIRLYQTSLHLAERSNDLEQVCRTQLWLMAAKTDAYGPDSLGTLASEVAWNVTKLGDPALRLFLHTTFAEVEGRRGAFDTSQRHIDLGLTLLEKQNNLWLEARLYLLRGAIAETMSNLHRAIGYTERALEVARESGCSLVESAAICNLGQLCITAGQLDIGTEYLQQARRLTNSVRPQRAAVLDALAQVELLRGRLDACEEWLSQLAAQNDDGRYIDLDNQATRLRFLQRKGDLHAALQIAETAINAASQRSAHLLHSKYRILCADILVDLHRLHDATQMLRDIEISPTRRSLPLLAEAERVQGRIAARVGARSAASARFTRAERILTSLGHLSSRDELLRQLAADSEEPVREDGEIRTDTDIVSALSSEPNQIISAAKMLTFAQTPLLLGSEAFDLVRASGTASRVALVLIGENNQRIIQSVDWPNPLDDNRGNVMRQHVGESENGSYVLLVEPCLKLDAVESVRSVFSFIAAAAELQEARHTRTLRTTLWPSDIALRDTGPVFYSEKMRALRDQALRMASTDLKVLITGETGVGKEVVARLIHGASKRANKRFDAVNCASVPRELFEAHLFGHRKGAFTGAVSDSPGVIRGNDGGTIFFDEIGELGVDIQVKLLRVLDAHEVHPLGEPHAISVDFRIVAATNADLHQLIEEKRFREDLFYRLNVATLRIPPLRERREEILPLAEHFLRMFCAANDRPLLTISDEAREHLLLYNWPGNIRELRNEMERLAGLVDRDGHVQPGDLKLEIAASRRTRPTATELGPNECVIRLDQTLESACNQISQLAIVAALKRHEGNLENAAKDLGLTRKGLYNKRLRFSML